MDSLHGAARRWGCVVSQIIPIAERTVGGDAIQTVSARDLHTFLEVGKQFGNWIADRIQQYGFQQGSDFEVFTETGKNLLGGRPAKEYALTLDMAKELAMVERNARGKQARQYFIECERRAKAVATVHTDPIQVLNDPAAMRGLLLTYSEKVLALEERVSDLQPKAAALDRIATADGSLCITEAAKALQVRPKDLFAFLRSHGWIYRRAGGSYELGYQERVNSGDLEHKVTTVLRADGSEKVIEQVRVTPKGLTKLAKLVKPTLAAVA